MAEYDLSMECLTTELPIEPEPVQEPQGVSKNGQAKVLPDGDAEAEKGKDKDKTEKQKLIPLYTLFRFATRLDILMILVGAVMSITSGVALPAHIFLFGRVINQFVYYEQAVVFQQIVRNQSLMIGLGCESFRDMIINGTIELTGIQNSVATAADTANISDFFICQQTSMFSDILNRVCDPQDVLIDEINMFTFIYIGLATGVLIVQLLSIMLWNISAYRQTQKMREAFYKSILRQEIGWFEVNDETAQLSTHLADDIENIQAGIGDKVVLFLHNISIFLAGYVIAFTFSWKLALVVTSQLPFIAVLTYGYAKLTASSTMEESNAYAAAGGVAKEVLGSIRTVVAFGGEQKEAKRYGDKLEVAKKEGIKKEFITSTVIGALFLIIICTFALGFWYGSTLIIGCELVAGDVVTVFFTVLYGGLFLGNALPEIKTFSTARNSATKVFRVIDREPVIDSSSDEGEIPDHLEGNVEFSDVIFHYPARPNVKILKGLDLKISKGQTVALVGPSGCGKSTTIRLLQRFYDPDAGLITIDGKDIKKLNLKWLRQTIGVVSQEPVLFTATIAENIRFGREEATMEEIEQAAKIANAYNFISELPDGFNTHVGEGGTQMSGGQKQRIAIARALVRDPKILLLDEATSALDTESERVVQSALDKAREGRTTIVIAHRLSTIQTADIISSIDHGRVVEMGNHHELMDNEGLYYKLVKEQTKVVADSDDVISTQLDGEEKEVNGVTEEINKLSWKELYKLNLPDWYWVLFGVIGSAILGAFYPLLSILFSEILRVFGEMSVAVIERDVRRLAGGFIGLAIAISLTYFTASFTLAVAGERLTKRMRHKTFKAMLRQDIAWFDDHANSTGALTTRLSVDASEVKGATGINLGFYLQMIFAFITAVIIAFIASWELTLVVMLLFPVFGIVATLQQKFVTGRSVENQKRQESSGQIVLESITNIRTVAALGVEERFLKKYEKLQETSFKDNVKSVFSTALVYALAQSMVFYIYCTGYRFGAFLVIEERATYDQVFRVFAAMVFTAFQLGQTSSSAPDVGKARASAVRIVTLLDRKKEVPLDADGPGLKPESWTGEISVNSVNFHYPSRPNVEVLRNLTFTVQPGQTLALVGPSGGGKSTIVSLIERFYDPVNSSGRISVDGNPVTDLNIKWLRSQIGLVSQEPVLFDTTIADNIRYGANFREVSDEEIIEAAKSANIHNFIESLPQRYNTNAGAKGTQLSGGEKQRVAIARALVRDPKILLLDEATSALDTESEKTVQEALDKAKEGRTSIVIAHRLSTIHNADCIAVIRNGELIESGTHAKLMDKRGVYYDLYTAWQKDKNT